MQYRLRTLLIVMGLAPPLIAGVWLFGADVVTSGAFLLAEIALLYLLFTFARGHAIAWIVAATAGFLSWVIGRR